ncbi:unnamed protein product, partial [Closterium sp. Naga37s-1]
PGLRDMKAQWSSIIPAITDTWAENADCNGFGSVTCNGAGFVTTIDLKQNDLTGSLPATISVFNSLEYLYIEENYLSGSLPSTFSKLVSLKEFVANNNQISGPLPDGIGALTNMYQL